ncbi:MAG: PAS domain S-box protein, partial [Phycisphaerae bacterium]
DSEMRIRALLDASPVCNKIIDLDSRLQYMSAAGVKQLKIPDVQAYYGCPYPPEIYPESMRTPLIKHLERAKAGETSRLECPVLDAEGGELWYHTTFAPVRDNEGRIQYVIGVSMDITERKQAEEALKISESKFRTLYDSTSDAVMLLDEEGFLDCNLATLKVFGCASREQFCGKHPSDLSPATQPCGTDSSALADRQIATALEKGTNRFEWIHKRADGTEFPAEVLLNVMTLGGRSILQAVVRDITDRKRAEEELRHTKAVADAANQAKSDFLANMSHEIRTPMTAILGFAENMLDPDQSESERLNCVHTIRRNGEYLIGLINDILDLSKVEAGKMTVERTACQPCRIIAEAASLMRVRADAKGLQFHIEYLGAIPETIQSDPTRLRQILINLVGNAIKFTEAGAVRLVTRFVERDHAPSLQFDVVDTGRGMTDEQAARLFQPFMQADNSTTRKFGGTGLGLTISKRFAELLGGDITIAATELGVGTTFRASVATGSLDGVKMLEDPVSATTVVDSTSAIARVAASDLSGLRILLAEDGPDNQRLISFVLKKAGADVTVEENGKLALDAALAARDEGKPFDCILMDMQMPVMDGYEATRQLRRKGYAAPIIAMTAHAMAGDRDKCLHAGCDDYATKPIDRKELITTIQARLHADAVA